MILLTDKVSTNLRQVTVMYFCTEIYIFVDWRNKIKRLYIRKAVAKVVTAVDGSFISI